AAGPRGRVLVVGGEEADRVVAPVVPQAPLDQRVVVHELVHRLELDGGDAERGEVLDGDGVGQAGVGAPQRLRDARVGGGEPLDVHLVDDRLVEGHVGRAVAAPVEVGVDDHALGHVGGAVLVVAAVGVAEVVGEAGRVPVHPAVDGLGVGVEQQLVGVAAVPVGRVPGTVD